MCKISKELFVESINAIKSGLEKRNKLDEALTAFSDSFFICNIGEEWLNQLIKILEFSMNDIPTRKYGSIISWWLFEDVEKQICWEASGKKYEKDLTTAEALYDYLVESSTKN